MGPKFEYTAHLIQAVLGGIGLGLVPEVFVREECEQGGIVIPDVPDLVPNLKRYWLIYTPDAERHPTLPLLRDWLLREAAGDAAQADARAGTARRR